MGARSSDSSSKPKSNSSRNVVVMSTTTASSPAAPVGGKTGGLKHLLFRRHRNSSSDAQPPLTAAKLGVDNSPTTEQAASLATSRSQRANRKGGKRGLFSSLLNPHKSKNNNLLLLNHNDSSDTDAVNSRHGALVSKNTGFSSVTAPMHNTQYGSSSIHHKQGGGKSSTHFSSSEPLTAIAAAENNDNSKRKNDLFQWQDEMEEQERRSILTRKQFIKERDGFCRRVDSYDGQVIHVEGKPAYELGNYLGGGVAGVVYEGHRLLPIDEYPVRSGAYDHRLGNQYATFNHHDSARHPAVVNTGGGDGGDLDSMTVSSFLCLPEVVLSEQRVNHNDNDTTDYHGMVDRDTSLLTCDSQSFTDAASLLATPPRPLQPPPDILSEDIALEATRSNADMVIIDRVDAPSRSKHLAKAVSKSAADAQSNYPNHYPSDASFTGGGMMEETVAVKILNPVGFRTLSPSATQTAVVARPGHPLEDGITTGTRPMEERHVWWLVNPSSRNLRTLQRYNVDKGPRTIEVDRGSPEKGLRISLVASYKDPVTQQLRELPLTKCIEIWGHVPFGASDEEFQNVMEAIDRVNQGQPPPPHPPSTIESPYRVATETTLASTNTVSESTCTATQSTSVLMDMPTSTTNHPNMVGPTPLKQSQRTGIYRAAYTDRQTVLCQELNAYIAIPAAPSKYLKWLRQRRAATKEIRNMMRIGRHRNVVHLFEVLELVQENKSTMFLILELVRGGELFDLISSNAAKISEKDKIPQGFSEAETIMRKFFQELASGVNYCHQNGIAHRDLKPENLLVHNSRSGDCVLKIADFGLSAVFGEGTKYSPSPADQDTIAESIISVDGSFGTNNYGNRNKNYNQQQLVEPSSPIKLQMDKLLTAGGSALSFLTCGTVDVLGCSPRMSAVVGEPAPLKRMTSVVGSPHYVAPEIISQSDSRKNKKDHQMNNGEHHHHQPSDEGKPKGYDGTKADVWSAGVILYAMLFRSLPFGEDLLRCPRFQSYRKWYDGVRKSGGYSRRTDIMSALNPVITDADEQNLLGPQWFFPSSSSREARDLIVFMLNPDPDMRPSIEHVLRHPWLLKEA